MEELEANVQSLKQEVESLKSTMEDKVEEMNGRYALNSFYFSTNLTSHLGMRS